MTTKDPSDVAYTAFWGKWMAARAGQAPAAHPAFHAGFDAGVAAERERTAQPDDADLVASIEHALIDVLKEDTIYTTVGPETAVTLPTDYMARAAFKIMREAAEREGAPLRERYRYADEHAAEVLGDVRYADRTEHALTRLKNSLASAYDAGARRAAADAQWLAEVAEVAEVSPSGEQ